jgi:uncharacterized repeat protein (TIGR01451 family)
MPKTPVNRPIARRSTAAAFAAATAVFAMTSGMAFGPGVAPSSAAPITPTTRSVSGTIFRDFNINSVRDVADRNTDGTIGATEWTEPGQVGITVSATCMSDTGPDNATGTATTTVDDIYGAPISVVSGADGSYLLTNLAAGKCRIDIVPPATMSFLFDTKMGASLVRFVDLSAGNSTQDAGLIDPVQYTGPTSLPKMLNGANWAGSATSAGVPDRRTTESLLVSGAFTRGDRTQDTNAFSADPVYTGTAPVELTSWSQHGAIWGLATQRTSGKIFAGAFMRRLAGLGSGGIDAIHTMASASATPTVFTTAVDTGTVDPEGSCTDATCRDFLDAEIRNRDIDAYSQVGTVGWGDLDMSADDRTLFAVNLFDKKLYKFPLNLDGTANGAAVSTTIPSPACSNGVSRPWGTSVHDGLVYAGVICDASTGTRADLAAFIYAYNPGTAAVALADGSGTVAAGAWSANLLADGVAAAGMQLDFDRACSARIGGTCRTTGLSTHWNPWSNDPAHEDDLNNATETRGYHQPILADIAFADDGGLILSFADRWAWQSSGSAHYTPVSGSTTEVANAQVGGDLIRTSAQATGTYLVENASGVTQGASLGGGTLNGWGSDPLVISEAGPGAGEFFNDDAIDDGGSGYWVHAESSEGGVLKIPGNPEIAFKQLDSDDELFTHGIAYAFETNGLRRGGQTGGTLSATCNFTPFKQCGYREFGTAFTVDQTGFGKASALTDLEALAEAAPVEVGNRVWYDANGNGVQDGGELPIPGVTVTLTVGANPARTAVTDGNGNYRFSSAAGTDDGANKFGVSELKAGATFTVAAPTTVSFGGGTRNITTKTAGTETGSDANTATGVTDVITINGHGQNTHAIDFGFTPAAAPLTYSIGNFIWIDNGVGGGTANDGIRNGGELPKSGVVVKLFAADGSGNPTGAALLTVTTDANGLYRFDGLTPLTYVVVVDPVNFQSGGSLENWVSSTGNQSTFVTANDFKDHGIDSGTAATTGVRAPAIVVAAGVTGEDHPATYAGGSTAGGTAAADNEDNLNVDFGFWAPAPAIATYNLGNRVWLDINHDGLRDSGEPGIDGVVLELLDATLTPTGASATTAGGGYYRFDDLVAGSYAVRVATTNFTTGALVNRISTNPDAASANNDIDDNDDGAGTAASAQSSLVVLGPIEPTTDADRTAGDAALPDASTNLSVDFGFVGVVDVGITKGVGTPTPATGETITYTLTITNHSVTNVSDVSVSDVLPAGLSGVSASGDGWVLVVTPGQLNGVHAGVLAPGESKTITFRVAVTATAGLITNFARVGVAGDTVAANNVDAVPVTLRQIDLPKTGADIRLLLAMAALALALGCCLLRVARRVSPR